MMELTINIKPGESRDSVKIEGVIDYYSSGRGFKGVINAVGKNKHEAVGDSIKQIDSLIKYLEESKASVLDI